MLFTNIIYSITAFSSLYHIFTEYNLVDITIRITILSAGFGNNIFGWDQWWVAFDIRAATSGVSYALSPENVIEMQCWSVCPKFSFLYLSYQFFRFPGQKHVPRCTRILSILWYNLYGQLYAAGAVVESSKTSIRDGYEDYSMVHQYVYWFSRHMWL